MYCVQSLSVLNAVALENTNSLSSNVVLVCASIVDDVVSLCMSFASSFNIYRELFIVNFPSLEDFLKLHSSNFAVKYPYSMLQINICAPVALDMS